MMNHRIVTFISVFLTAAVVFTAHAELFAQDPVCPLGEGWKFNAYLSDEFDQDQLDVVKWFNYNPIWRGRKPAMFCKENVYLKDGKLCLRADVAPEGYYSEQDRKNGFHTFRTAAVQSRLTVLYGYFEVRSKPMNSTASSSFWFYKTFGPLGYRFETMSAMPPYWLDKNTPPEVWTEIDVYEMSARHPKFGSKYIMTTHVNYTPENKHLSWSESWDLPFKPAEDFHVYALEWTKEHLKWYVDGQCVRELKNEHWHQPLTINFDSETMPSWFGLPDPKDLPSVFEIDYIRVWQQ